MTKIAIKYRSKKNNLNQATWCWVCYDRHDLIAYGCPVDSALHKDDLKELHTFDDPMKAVAFIEKWRGNPWYYMKGDAYELVEVVPHMVTYQSGWKLAI